MYHLLRTVTNRLAKQAVKYDYNKLYAEALTLYGVCCTLLNAEITVYLLFSFHNRHGILAVMSL